MFAAEEVQPVIKELRAAGIDVTAIHSHMLDERPAADLHARLGE